MDWLIEKTKKMAADDRVIDAEDFNSYDDSGGNFDDAWQSGIRDGEITLARAILAEIERREPERKE